MIQNFLGASSWHSEHFGKKKKIRKENNMMPIGAFEHFRKKEKNNKKKNENIGSF